jgi:hypothetical protein
LTSLVIVPRATPAPMRSFPVTMHQNATVAGSTQNDDLAEKLLDMKVSDSLSIPSFGSPSVSIASSSTVFGSSPTEMGHFYVGYPWIDGDGEERVTMIITLSSVPVKNYEFSVSPCGFFLRISTRLPSILTDATEFNNRCFKKDGKPLYCPSDFRCVSHSRAVCALRMAMGIGAGGSFFIPQNICLPFRCETLFSSIDGRSGISIKAFDNGMKVAIIELLQFSAVGRTSRCRELYGDIDDVSLATHQTANQPVNFSGQSVVSISYSTGLARDNRYERMLRPSVPTPICEIDGMNVDDNDDDDESEYTEVTEVSAVPSVRSVQSKIRIESSNKRRNLRSLDGSLIRPSKGLRGTNSVSNIY